MYSRLFAITSLFAVIALSGCNAYTLVKNEPTKVGSEIMVDPQREWSRIKLGDEELWTVDGVSLQAVRFIDGVEDGETLYDVSEEAEHPTFSKSMTPSDVAELVRDTMIKTGMSAAEPLNLRPFDVDGSRGFRFEMAFTNGDGLKIKAMVAGTIREERLYLVWFSAPGEYYFDRYKNEADRLLSSLRFQSA